MNTFNGDRPLERRVYEVREVAQLLGCRIHTVYRAIAAGEIPAFRVGRNWKIPKGEIDERVKSGKASTGKEGSCQ